MPRPMRIQSAGLVHHVVTRGNNHQALFEGKADYTKYVSLLEEARKLYPIKIFNYCLMDNHIHLLLEPTEEGSLSKFMEHVQKAYAKYFNKKYNRTGHLFGGRFKSFIIDHDRYFFACSRYIDLNPVKAKMTGEPKAYPYSGHSHLAYGTKSLLNLNHHSLYMSLGATYQERQIAYKALVMSYQGEDLDLLNRRAGIIGGRDFKNKVRNK